MAEKLHLAGNTQISKFENDKSEPSIEVLRKLAAIGSVDIQIDLHELITGEPSAVVELCKRENKGLLELLAKYISFETARLLEERHQLWGELGVAEERERKGLAGRDQAAFWKAEITRIEKRIADVTEDQHYVQEALTGIK